MALAAFTNLNCALYLKPQCSSFLVSAIYQVRVALVVIMLIGSQAVERVAEDV